MKQQPASLLRSLNFPNSLLSSFYLRRRPLIIIILLNPRSFSFSFLLDPLSSSWFPFFSSFLFPLVPPLCSPPLYFPLLLFFEFHEILDFGTVSSESCFLARLNLVVLLQHFQMQII